MTANGTDGRTAESGGPDRALARLYLAERLPMVRLATLLLGSPWQAEEVVQDAFVQVSDRWAEIDNHGGYLRTTVVNGCRALLRRGDVENRYLVSSQPTVDVEAFLPSHLIELHQALQGLDERARTVVVLRYLLDLPDEEVADTIGVAPSTVRTISFRALRTLRKELS